MVILRLFSYGMIGVFAAGLGMTLIGSAKVLLASAS